jgi:hemerythrin superfamily protein
MKSLATQSESELGGRGSVLARQKRDHIRLDGLLQRLDEVPADGQDAVLLKIYRLVFPHAFAEEAVLWPVIRRVLPEGHALTLQVELEHQRINELVTELEALEPGSPAHRQVLDRVVELLREDVHDEEDALLPRLQEKLSAARLRRLGIAWEIVRAIAPTRAHPIVARRPPGNILSALPLALLDRLRDMLDARLQSGGAAAPALRRVSSALAGRPQRQALSTGA